MDFYTFPNLVTCLITCLALSPGRGNRCRPVGRREFVIPRAWNQLFRFCPGAQPYYIEIWRTRLSPAISRRRLTRAWSHHAKSPVCSTAGGARRGSLAPTDEDDHLIGCQSGRSEPPFNTAASPPSCPRCLWRSALFRSIIVCIMLHSWRTGS
jgi:hypothetical protein